MAKQTKKQVAELIVSEFPDRGDSVDGLVADHTLAELEALLSDLRGKAEDGDEEAEQAALASDAPASDEPAQAVEEDLYRLADPSKHYHGVKFNLKGDEAKPLPAKVDGYLAARIRAGFIVKVGD